MIPFAVVLISWGDASIRLWAGPEVIPSTALLVGMAFWSVLPVLGSVVWTLLNSLHVAKFQAVAALLMATANILLSIYLIGKIRALGAIVGTVCAYTIFSFLPAWYCLRHHCSVFSAAGSNAGGDR